MHYQQEKIKYIADDFIHSRPTTVILRRTTALINQIEQVCDLNLQKILSDLTCIDVTNFLDEIISSILRSNNKGVEIAMTMVFKLSKIYDEFDHLFVNALRETLRKKLKTDDIEFYVFIYAEICSCGIEKRIKFNDFLRKTMTGNFYRNKLKVMYATTSFLNNQISELKEVDVCHEDVVKSLIEYYDGVITFIQDLYAKIDKTDADPKYLGLLNSLLKINYIPHDFIEIVKLTDKEKKVYKHLGNCQGVNNTKSLRLSTSAIVENIHNPQFVVKNMSQNQKKVEFMFELIDKNVKVEHVAEVSAYLNLDFEQKITDYVKHFKNNMTADSSLQVDDMPKFERRIYLACELFKFYAFSRSKMLDLLYFLLKTKKYDILVNCLERCARFLLAKEYSSAGNMDIINLLLNLNNNCTEIGVSQRIMIKNCMNKIVENDCDRNNDLHSFMEFTITQCPVYSGPDMNRRFAISNELDNIFKNNRLFLFQHLLELWSFSDLSKLAEILKCYEFDSTIVRECVFTYFTMNEKHKAIGFAKLYSYLLKTSIMCDITLLDSIQCFNRKIFFSSVNNNVLKVYLVCEFLQPFSDAIKRKCCDLVSDFVDMNDDFEPKSYYINFCRMNDLPHRESMR